MRRVNVCAIVLSGLVTLGVASSWARDSSTKEIDFLGKTITVDISADAGSGNDMIGRIVGRYLHEYLPGKPTVLFQNIPGAGGITALNYFAQQVKPDGLTSMVGTASNLDPTVIRTPSVHYDTAKLMMYGGFPAPSGVLILRKDAVKRFYNRSLEPAIMGDESAVRTADQMAVWGPDYLNWNVRWVLGYPGSNEIILAAMRGEIDLVATYDRPLIAQLMDTGHFMLPVQTGDAKNGKFVPSENFPGVPVFSDLIRPVLKDPEAIKAFKAWETLEQIGK